MPHVVTQHCCSDAACIQACPVNCIHPAPGEPEFDHAEMLYIDPAVCIDCGACADVCPVRAIASDYDLPRELLPYVELNATWYEAPTRRDYPRVRAAGVTSVGAIVHSAPLRVAIVGSGPSACYTAEQLLDSGAEVTMLERLATPWGLARLGVAPDHQETKYVISEFERTALRAGFTLHLQVEVGRDVSHEELMRTHQAVVYATGASDYRRLDVPGETLSGSCSAAGFVAWYNGHPAYAEHEFPLATERAVVIGNGNVSLDVARVLLSPVDVLARTDIADHALDQLAESRVREVVLVGRRGPKLRSPSPSCSEPGRLGASSRRSTTATSPGL